MENRNVATFVKVVEYNNFTKAAQSLGYSQAAVTAQIKQLEKELGAPLFDRMGKRIRLTRAGERFLPYAVTMLKAEEEALACIKEQGDFSGILRIGASSSLSMGALPHIAMEFVKEHPDVRIAVRVSDFIDDLLDRLNTGEIDIIFVMGETNKIRECTYLMEKDIDIVFVTHPDNPLAGKKVSLEEFLQQPVVVSDRAVGYTYYLDQIVEQQGFELDPVLESGSVASIVKILEEGYGVSYIPYFMCRESLEQGKLALIDVDFPDPHLKSRMLCHKSKWVDPMMEAFIKYANNNHWTKKED